MKFDWVKGSLPAWIVAGLFGFSVWAGQRWVVAQEKDRDAFREQIAKHTIDMTVLSGNLEVAKMQVQVLERGQAMMLEELRLIRRRLEDTTIRERPR